MFDATFKNESDDTYRLMDPTRFYSNSDPDQFANWTHHFLPGPWEAFANAKDRRAAPRQRVLKAGEELTVEVMISSFRYAAPGTKPVDIDERMAPKQLPPGNYQYRPTISFGAVRDNNPTPFWTGEITAKPVAFAIGGELAPDEQAKGLFDPKRRDAAPVVVRLKKIEIQGRELGRLHYYGRVESVYKYDLKNLPVDSIRVRDPAPPKEAAGLKNVYFVGRLGEGDKPLPEGCSATIYIGGFAESVWHLYGGTIGKGASHVTAANAEK